MRADYYGTPLFGWADSADIVVASKFQKEFGYAPGFKQNPKGKGPLTTAYSTAQGIVPGLLGIGDSGIRGVRERYPQRWNSCLHHVAVINIRIRLLMGESGQLSNGT